MRKRAKKSVNVIPKMGNFASSAAPRFSGSRNYEVVIKFLEDINEYKKQKYISDAYALTNIHHSLQEDALVWWNEIRRETSTWNDFETRLRAQFAPVKPNYVLYKEIMTKTKSPLPLDVLIQQKMELVSQLPEHHDIMLDMIYASIVLQDYPIQEKIPRETVNTCDEFLKAAQDLIKRERSSSYDPKDAADPASTLQGVRCSYRRSQEHFKEQCKRGKRILEMEEALTPSTSGATSGGHTSGATSGASASGANDGNLEAREEKIIPEAFLPCPPKDLDDPGRPVVYVEIAGVKEIGVLMMFGASESFLSHRMYQHLVAKGIKFAECYEEIQFAKGPKGKQHMYRAQLGVRIEGRTVLNTFYVWKDWMEYNTWTYLGPSFVDEAKMYWILGKRKRRWYYNAKRIPEYRIYGEFDTVITSAIEAYQRQTQRFLKGRDSPESPTISSDSSDSSDSSLSSNSSTEVIHRYSGALIIYIEIEGVRDLGLIRTGADHSILSSRMYKHLVGKGIQFDECYEEINFDLGPDGPQHMYKAVLKVTLEKQYVVPTLFYVWIGIENPYTYLGTIFLYRDAEIELTLDKPRKTWNFCANKNQLFDTFVEGHPIVNSAAEAYKLETEQFLKKVARSKLPRFVGNGEPVVFVEIEGVDEIAYLKPHAGCNILSYRVYNHLVAKGKNFHDCYADFCFTVGPIFPDLTSTAILFVTLEDRVIPTRFFVWKPSNDMPTWLGGEFIGMEAKMIMNFDKPFTWHKKGRQHEKFFMYQDDDPLVISAIETYKEETKIILELKEINREKEERKKYKMKKKGFLHF